MISQAAPGKLYVAGEYAVVEPGHRAVLVAVDRFITVRITPAEHAGRITSPLYATGQLTWYRRPGDGMVEVEQRIEDYVVSAIRTVERMVRDGGGHLGFFDLDVVSELDDGEGRKLGLGSSAAVTVATVRAVAQLYDLPLDDLAVYKLALLASDAIQPIGSGGDIAASAFTGWVDYSSPDRAWLHRARTTTEVEELVSRDWPGLDIRRLPTPSLRLHAGWTGAPASTPRLVSEVRTRVQDGGDASYAAFLRESQTCVAGLVEALGADDTPGVARRIDQARELLADLAAAGGITVETPLLRRLVEIARSFGIPAKSSGAGGGDCGIALCPPGSPLEAMFAAWSDAGVRPLDLSVHARSEVTP